MKQSVVLFLIASLLLYAVQGTAYEILTHEKLSEVSAKNSILSLDLNVLKNLGLQSIEDDNNPFPNSKGEPKNILNLIKDGARFEDSLLRPINHFFDPISGDTLLPLAAKPSPTWALEDKGTIVFPLLQRYSFADARDYLYKALTVSDEKERKKNFGLTFETLGRVIHHIQDMAQPQHVRLDAHLKLSDADQPDWFFENGSRYEAYTKGLGDNLPFDAYAPVNNKDDTNNLTTARSFWHTAQGGGMGLAEFTNTNFVSTGTNFRGAFQNGGIIAQPNARYALPAPSPATPSYELVNNLLGPDTPVECSPPNNPCVMVFFSSEVKDNYRQITKVNDKASTASIFDQDLQFYGKTVSYPNLDKCTDPSNTATCEHIQTGQIFSLNRFNFDESHKFLIPRAMAYSAGLIDYFFRGKLEAEDVTFTDTGLTLRVKNSIDPAKTPAWANEILYAKNSSDSAGSLVVAFDYQDSAGKTHYGVSEPIPVRASDTLAPGQVSDGVYDFTLTVPPEAKDVNYRLVFRGRLGQEDDAIAVGAVEPISGFLVTPNYLPTDGITGPRAIFKQGGQWRLSDKKGLVAGNIDWKGWYVNGKPTKVLTWYGPKARYFPNPSGYSAPFTPNIFQNGELFSVAPHDVLGAALMKDTDGKEWLIAICKHFGSDVVYRRPNIKSDSPDLYDPVTAVDGWQEIGRFSPEPGWNLEIPWFFNGSGTEAQTMRRITTYIFDSSGRITGSKYGGLDRARMEIIGSSAMRTNLGNYSGITDTSTCERIPFPSENCLSYEVSLQENQLRDGKYIIAVDYLNNQEILAVISDTRSRKYDYSASRNYIKVNDVCSGFEQQVTSLNVESGALSLSIGSRSYDLVKNDGTWLYRVDSVSNFYTTSASAEVSYSSVNERNELHYVDLRYGLLEGRTVQDSFVTAGAASSNRSNFTVPTTLNTGRVITQEIKSNIANQLIYESSENTSMPYGIGASLLIWLDSCGTVGSNIEYPDYRTIVTPLNGSWVVDGGENLLVSQEYTGQNGAKRNFNYLTSGDLHQLIRTAPEDARYQPSGVIK